MIRRFSAIALAGALVCIAVPVAAQAQMSPVKREALEFPREAVRAGVETGSARVKLAVDASGNVTDVQIVESSPQRVFDRVIRTSMVLWKFPAGDEKRSYETVVEFKR
jgi:protein TonB